MNKEKKTTDIKEAIKIKISGIGNHACRNDSEGMCAVTSMASDELVFVNNKKYPQCPYYVPFGSSGLCNFPARREIYKKYST